MDIRSSKVALALACMSVLAGARAQTIVHADEDLARTRPEAWAMNYMAASTLMTAFGTTPSLATGQWQLAGDLGHIPRLDDSQQRVGFFGTKQEDLNRSPVFGRIRAVVGLPGEFVGEIGYTPQLTLDGTQPRDMWALSLGRRIYARDSFSGSLRGIAQYGRVHGDITCPARIAYGNLDDNPVGCREPSDDRVRMKIYGVDATGAWSSGPWQAHGGVGYAWTRLEVQVNALTFDARDRSLLTADGGWPYLVLGGGHDIDKRWNVAAELLYVPLRVQRQAEASTASDPLTSLRLRLLYRF